MKSALVLIAANTAPLFGVLFFGWDVPAVVTLYWVETVIIGLFTLPRIALSQAAPRGPGRVIAAQNPGVAATAKTITAGFFAFHFGMFMYVYSMFLAGQFGLSVGRLGEIWPAIAALIFSHGYSFFHNFVSKKEFLQVTLQEAMFKPYPRIVPMHLMIIFGGFFFGMQNGQVGSLFILIGLKTAADLGTHFLEHKKLQSLPPSSAAAEGERTAK